MIDQHRWDSILNVMSDGVAIAGTDDRLLYANRAFYELIKQPYGTGLGESLEALLHPQRAIAHCVVCTTRQRGLPGRFKLTSFEAVNPTGRALEVIVEPVRDDRGKLLEIIETMRDLTEVERSAQRFVQCFESAPEGIILQDPSNFAIIDANQRACELFGYTKQEFLRTPFVRLIPDHEIDAVQAAMINLRRTGAMRLETTISRKDGFAVPVEVSARLITMNSDPIVQVILRDITERRIVEQMLRERSELAKQLSEATLRAQEEERRHLARELHDGVGQTLSALKFHLEVLRYKTPQQAHAALPELSGAVGETVNTLRNLAMQLRPSQLDDLGLVETVRWHAQQFQLQTGIQVVFRPSQDRYALTKDVCVHLYRIVQEALSNICKHARATAVDIQLAQDADGILRLAIRDNGAGFDPAAVRQEAGHFHMGLSSMRERVGMIHGELQIDSAPGEGTALLVSVGLQGGAQS